VFETANKVHSVGEGAYLLAARAQAGRFAGGPMRAPRPVPLRKGLLVTSMCQNRIIVKVFSTALYREGILCL
jgi:hypothetical protein